MHFITTMVMVMVIAILIGATNSSPASPNVGTLPKQTGPQITSEFAPAFDNNTITQITLGFIEACVLASGASAVRTPFFVLSTY
jgi:hypothetical protein